MSNIVKFMSYVAIATLLFIGYAIQPITVWIEPVIKPNSVKIILLCMTISSILLVFLILQMLGNKKNILVIAVLSIFLALSFYRIVTVSKIWSCGGICENP